LNGLENLPLDQPWLALPLMFVAGLLTSTFPCVWPMIPITAAVLGGVGSARPPRRRVVLSTACYVLGLTVVYSSLGLLAGLTGSLFGAVGSHPAAYLVMGNMMLLFGLLLLDVVPIRLPAGLARRLGTSGGAPGSYPAMLALGATSGLVAAPCGAPAFGAVLLFVGAKGSPVWGFGYLLVFSLGMSAVLVAVGLFSGLAASLPKSGGWTVWIKRGAAVVLLIVAQYYFVQAGKVL